MLQLRVPTEEDAKFWCRMFDDPEVMEFHGGNSWADLSYYLRLGSRQRKYAAELGFCLWSVLTPDGDVAGFAGAQPWQHDWGPAGQVTIGWRLGRDFWGRGYATEAAQMGLRKVREAGVKSVVAVINVKNERSIAVARRLGMERLETLIRPDVNQPAYHFRLVL
ncbi:GNAT family N-acetyltransferase [Streptomyces sp. NPDC001127]|uniref:GNAT family N-acetyltransferase n=1 Tax=Streptomyces sp. NPDC001127 TaxID=3154377 RepID=UPI00332A3107